ncbi:hypothetical protein SHIRM173S_00159 [Streptomyces hirsutus]
MLSLSHSETRAETVIAPSGTYPEFRPLAVRMSGVTSQWLQANHSPVRPKPAMTSSKMSRMPYRSQTSRSERR